MKGSNQAGTGLGPLGRWKGRTKAVERHRPLDRWTGQTKLAGVWSVGSVGGSNQGGGGGGAPRRGFGRGSGALPLSGSREFKGRPRDNKTIGSVQLKLPFPRSIDKVSTGARGAHQATAPSTQLVGCDGGLASMPGLAGPWPVKDQLKINLSLPCNSAEFFLKETSLRRLNNR